MRKFFTSAAALLMCAAAYAQTAEPVQYDLGIKASFPAEGVVDMTSVTWAVTTFSVDGEYDLAPNSKKEATLTCATSGYNSKAEIQMASQTDFVRTFKFVNGMEPYVDGTYITTIPAGTFGDAAWQANPETGHTNPEIKIYYFVTGNGGTVSTQYTAAVETITPADNATVNVSESPVTLSFTAQGDYSFYPTMKINVESEQAEYSSYATISSAEVKDGVTTFYTKLAKPITVNGTYTVSIPQGIFGSAEYVTDWTKGVASQAFTSSFTVTGGLEEPDRTKFDLIPTVTPAENSQLPVKEKIQVTLAFPEGTRPVVDDTRIAMQCKSANYYLVASVVKGEASGSFVLNYGQAPKRAGTYTINIPENTFYNEKLNRANPDMTITYEVQSVSIDSLEADETVTDPVYTITGIYVGENTDNLPEGIYLQKGKKIIVK